MERFNKLYGPGWNLGVPKFAVLEPLKPEILTPEVVSPKPPQHTEPVASFPTDVPSVQFDWTSAGLTNPLDYSQTMLLDIEQFVATFDVSSCSPISQNSNSLWDIWLETAQNDEQQQPSGNINLDWNFLDANTKTDITQCNVQATEASPAHSLNLEVNLDSLSLKSEGDDSQRDNYHIEEIARIDILANMIPLRETHICDESSSKAQFVISNSDNVQEDDFDDFQMSLPVVTENQIVKEVEPLTPQLHCLQPIPAEPLRPVVVHQTATSVLPAKIEWPAPGITEDDIHGIELTYTTKQPQTKEIEIKPEANIKKPSAEDDDWTDFISHKETTRTSPEKVQNNLQLSVFNLSNIQPIKPPVPVITPKGVIQTKLSSSGTISPISSPLHSHRPQQRQLSVKPPDGYQPSIISQQYLDNTNQNRLPTNNSVSLNNYNMYSTPYNHQSDSFFVPNTKHNTNPSACDDDDWTDFVSSQPVEQQSVSFTPNIIANPNRYDPLREFRLNGDVLNNSGNRRASHKSSVPSVTNLPDLDFVISKNRTFMKK